MTKLKRHDKFIKNEASMTLIELAEQIVNTIENFEDSDQGQAILIDMFNEAIENDDVADLHDAIESGLIYLNDCDCEDADYYRNKYEAIVNSDKHDEEDF